MRVRSFIAGMVVALSLAALPVEAVTLCDIVELSRAGLSDNVLVALIEVDHTRFDLDAARLLELKAAGVSEPVMVALLRSGRVATPADPPAGALSPARARTLPAAPSVVVVAPQSAPAPVFPTIVAVPFVVPTTGHHRRGRPVLVSPERFTSFGVSPFFGLGLESRSRLRAPGPPVFWGWGGQRRPDTWRPGPPAPALHPRR